MLACVVLAGTSEGLAGPRILEGARCRVPAPNDLGGSILVKILHSVEGGDVEQGCSNLETNLSCLLLLFLSLLCLHILLMLIVHISYILDIFCS